MIQFGIYGKIYILKFEEYITKDNYEISGESYENMEIHIYISIK